MSTSEWAAQNASRPGGRWKETVRPLLGPLWGVAYYLARPGRIARAYRPADLQPDLIAGLTVGLIVLPQAIAYALVAELPPQMGLYAAIIGSLVGALWGSSHQLQTGPTNTSSLLTLSALALVATPGTADYVLAAGLLALMVGILGVLLGLARLGMLVRFVSDSVIVGFTAGAGVLIAVNQVRHLLGLPIPSTAELLDTVQLIATHIGQAHGPTVALGLGTVAVVVLLRRLSRRLPGPLVAMVAASVAVGALGLNVKVVEQLPRSLPPLSRLPLSDLDLIGKLSGAALSVGLIGLVEALSIARVIAVQTRQRLDSNQEFVGQGLANIVCGLFSGYPTSGSFTRSAVNLQAGARTALASVFTGAFVLIAMLGLAPLARYIPLAALAGVLMVIAYGLIDRREMARIWRCGAGERATMLVTLVATLFLPLHVAVLGGILMSLAQYLFRTSAPRVRTVLPSDTFRHWEHRPGEPGCPQLSVVEILGDLYFGAVQHVEERIERNLELDPGRRFLLLRMGSVENCDVSGIHALENIVRAYRERHGDVFMVRVRQPVLEVMRAAGFSDLLGADHLLDEDVAIDHLFYRVLDPAICIYECPVRAFLECQNLPKREEPVEIPWPADLSGSGVAAIEPGALWQALHGERPPLVIDVRESREFRQGHIPGAKLVPLPTLLAEPAHVPRTGTVVLVCRGGRRSSRAAALLRHQGYDHVLVLQGGMLAWEAANLLEATDQER